MAVSAPHWVSSKGIKKFQTFNSKTPFSLQNALRDAVGKAERKEGAWGRSNFVDSKKRNAAVILMEFWEEEKEYFISAFKKNDPDILFIGAMTLSLPGAIEIASLARELKEGEIFIVIGGKHCNETFYKNKSVYDNLDGSPLKLMASEVIPPVFDLVFSGDGEKAITSIGEIIELLLIRNLPFKNFNRYRKKFEQSEGDWVAGQYKDNQIIYYEGNGDPIDYNELPFAINQFKLNKSFKVFNTLYTAHVYSDLSKGCPYNCFFCSEKNYISGKLRIKNDISAIRLFKQFQITKSLQKNRFREISLFVEDSIFLGAREELIELFIEKLNDEKLVIPFGCQFTLDTFLYLEEKGVISRLAKVGLEYIAFGVETEDEDIARTFSKNTNKKNEWLNKIELVIIKCKENNLKCGMFLLWGLGESSKSRKSQLSNIQLWSKKHNVFIDVGLNIATEHPLRNKENRYNYVDWGTDKDSPYFELFIQYFGEASEKYRLSKINFPSVDELRNLIKMYENIKRQLYGDEEE